MVKETKTTVLLSATECELLTLSDEVILNEVIEHFEDLQDAVDAGSISETTRKQMDTRLCHCGILFAEGQRLSAAYPELGRKLILASIFWGEQRGLRFLTPEERRMLVDSITERRIQEAEEMKKQKRKKDEIVSAFIKAVLKLNYFTESEITPLDKYLKTIREEA